MIKDFNEWYNDVDISATKEKLTDRFNGIENLCSKICSEIDIDSICNLVRLYYGLNCDDEFRQYFVSYFNSIDPTFSASYLEEINLLAGASLVYISENERKLGYFTELLVLTNSFYHLPTSSHQIQSRIIEEFDNDRIALRKVLKIKDNLLNDLINLKEKIENEDEDEESDRLLELLDLLISSRKENNKLINMLQIYKEDSQILWWMNSQWSNILNCSLNDVKKEQACIILGFEASEMVEEYPGPYAIKSVLKNMIKLCKGTLSEIDINKVLSSTDENWKKEVVRRSTKIPFIDLLPIHSAINRANNTTAKEQWYPKYEQEVLLNNQFKNCFHYEYAFRMYLESLLLKLYLDI